VGIVLGVGRHSLGRASLKRKCFSDRTRMAPHGHMRRCSREGRGCCGRRVAWQSPLLGDTALVLIRRFHATVPQHRLLAPCGPSRSSWHSAAIRSWRRPSSIWKAQKRDRLLSFWDKSPRDFCNVQRCSRVAEWLRWSPQSTATFLRSSNEVVCRPRLMMARAVLQLERYYQRQD